MVAKTLALSLKETARVLARSASTEPLVLTACHAPCAPRMVSKLARLPAVMVPKAMAFDNTARREEVTLVGPVPDAEYNKKAILLKYPIGKWKGTANAWANNTFREMKARYKAAGDFSSLPAGIQKAPSI